MVKDVRLSVRPGYVSGYKAPCPNCLFLLLINIPTL